MNCENKECNKVIEQPLELYNGEWACPYCRTIMGNIMTDFVITKENDQIFQLAESCYYAWLDAAVHTREGSRNTSMLNKAIELTREAAATGNPEAAVRLGYYYDKDYTEVNKSEVSRCRAAYAYYSAVCFADINKFKAEKDVTETHDFAKLRERAARYMLKMLASAPEELTKIQKFNYNDNADKVKKQLNMDIPPVEESGGVKPSAQQQAFDKLRSCFSRQKAPLFGIFKLSGEEFKALAAIKSAGDGVIKFIKRGVFLAVAPANENGKVDDGTFEALKNERAFNEYLQYSVEEENDYWLFFFNEKGGHRFYGKFALDKIRKALTAADYELVAAFIESWAGEDLTFLDDDIYMCKDKTTIKNAVSRLEDAVRQGGFNG